MKYKPAILILTIFLLASCLRPPENIIAPGNEKENEGTEPIAIVTQSPGIEIQTIEIQTQETIASQVAFSPAEIKTISLSDQKWNECNSPLQLSSPSDENNHAQMMEDGNLAVWGDAYISAEVNEPPHAEITAAWYIGETGVNPRMQEDFNEIKPLDRYVTNWNIHSSQKDVTAIKACDGKYYLHLTTPPLEEGFGVTGTWLSPRKVVFISGGDIIGEKQFYLQQ